MNGVERPTTTTSHRLMCFMMTARKKAPDAGTVGGKPLPPSGLALVEQAE